VDLTIEYDPDSITLYQMELPFNTVYSKAKLRGEEDVPPFADWRTKREWHAYAFEQFERAGFERWSAYTMMRRDRGCKFVYAREVWSGADMIPIGVSSFGHMGGVHMQNHDRWDGYLAAIDAGGLAISYDRRPTRPGGPPRLRPAGRVAIVVRGLQPNRTSRHGTFLRRPYLAGSISAGTGHPLGHRRDRLWHPAQGSQLPGTGFRQTRQLRPHVRHGRLWPGQ